MSFGLLLAGVLLVPAAYLVESATREAGGGAKVGAAAPAFSLESLESLGAPGGAVALGDLTGQVVLLDFWATWCAPCRKTLPGLSDLMRRNPGLAVLAASLDEDRAKARDFLRRLPGGNPVFRVLHDSGRKAAETYGLKGMPAAVLIDGKGILRGRYDGYTERDLAAMETAIRALLEEKP
ncbi:MAG TPA: TlpA disulfide reductase family protein [Fibrobacteria bacterium]|nr:TlpA disulfide reductase family protein [Fibrobacteria bacterium]